MFRRVANHIAKAEKKFKSPYAQDEIANDFYDLMTSFKFLPNSPTLMNAGRRLGQLAACFVLPVEDSMENIFSTLKNAMPQNYRENLGQKNIFALPQNFKIRKKSQ